MGYVYKFTHRTTGKWYIGSHNGKKKRYDGGGLLFAHAKRKYGISSFDKTILYEGDEFRKEEERILGELDAASDPMSYNMKNEALGGSFFGSDNGMFGRKHNTDTKFKCGSAFRGKKRPDHALKMSGESNPSFGKNSHAHGIIDYAKRCAGKTYEEIHGELAGTKLKEKLSKIHTGKKKTWVNIVCPHCYLIGRGPNMTRYHFENCKNKP